MSKYQTKLKNAPTNLARSLAPEDIIKGRFIAVHYLILELLDFSCGSSAFDQPKIIPTKWLPYQDPQPLKVIDVCLPFVLIETADRKQQMVDVRRYRFVEISSSMGQRLWKEKKKKKSKKRKRKKN